MATNDELEDLSKVKMTKNTIQSGFLDTTIEIQMITCPDEILLPSCSVHTLSKWLCVYVAETRSQTGEAYPPTIVHSLLSGILRHMKSVNPMYPNFFDKNDQRYTVTPEVYEK